jgi:hypothetical protein
MPTRNIRDYGPIGSGSAAQDNATFKKAVAASKAGDTLTLPYDPAGHNTIRLASNTKLWNGGTLASDEGIEYRKSDATAGAIFDCSILRSFLFTLGQKNGKGSAIDPLAAGKWVVNVDKAVTKCNASSGIALFKTAQGIQFEDVAGIMNWSTITGGKASANQTNVALFRYPGVKTSIGPQDITLRRATAIRGPFGYGLTQVQSGAQLKFYEIFGLGGKTLRLEQDANGSNHIDGLVADGVWCRNGASAVSINPHSGWLHNARITNVTTEEASEAIRIAAGVTNTQNVVIDGASLMGSSTAGSTNAQVRGSGASGISISFFPGPSQEDISGSVPRTIRLANISSRGVWKKRKVISQTDPWTPGTGFTQKPPAKK